MGTLSRFEFGVCVASLQAFRIGDESLFVADQFLRLFQRMIEIAVEDVVVDPSMKDHPLGIVLRMSRNRLK